MRQEIAMLGTSEHLYLLHMTTWPTGAKRLQLPNLLVLIRRDLMRIHLYNSPIFVERFIKCIRRYLKTSFRLPVSALYNLWFYDGRSKQKDFCLIFSGTLEDFFSFLLHCSDLRDTNGHPWHQFKHMQDLWRLGYFWLIQSTPFRPQNSSPSIPKTPWLKIPLNFQTLLPPVALMQSIQVMKPRIEAFSTWSHGISLFQW